MSYQVKIEKLISRPSAEVFRALKEGRLFMNCGSDSQSMQIDFRVGGKYRIDFKQKALSNFGEFLEIVPDRKIVFSWCQTFGADQNPDTKVSIELFPDGPKTRLVLTHTGFKGKATCDNHEKGWIDGTRDFAAEIERGTLRMVRSFNVPADKLFKTLNTPSSFFAHMGDLSRGSIDMRTGGKYQVPTEKGEIRGEFLEIVPNKKIVMSWLSGCHGPLDGSKVTLNLTAKDETSSTVEIVHEGLLTEADQKAHRHGWENITKKLSEVLS